MAITDSDRQQVELVRKKLIELNDLLSALSASGVEFEIETDTYVCMVGAPTTRRFVTIQKFRKTESF